MMVAVFNISGIFLLLSFWNSAQAKNFTEKEEFWIPSAERKIVIQSLRSWKFHESIWFMFWPFTISIFLTMHQRGSEACVSEVHNDLIQFATCCCCCCCFSCWKQWKLNCEAYKFRPHTHIQTHFISTPRWPHVLKHIHRKKRTKMQTQTLPNYGQPTHTHPHIHQEQPSTLS